MKIDVSKIKRMGKTEDDFSFEFTPDVNLIDLPNTEFDGNAKIEGAIFLCEGDDAYIKGEITFTLKGECSRCLKETSQTFTFPIEEDFSVSGKEGFYTYSKGIIDLTKCAVDNIVMNMPMKLLCDENCEGISYKID